MGLKLFVLRAVYLSIHSIVIFSKLISESSLKTEIVQQIYLEIGLGKSHCNNSLYHLVITTLVNKTKAITSFSNVAVVAVSQNLIVLIVALMKNKKVLLASKRLH